VPLRRSTPYQLPKEDWGEAYHLNAGLVNWAFNLTKNVELPDNPKMRAEREQFHEANARRPPFVLKGDTLSASTYWHGKLLNQWANDWVRYHTGGHGNYVTTAMEDTGTLQSLTFLAKAGRVDLNRVLVLRTASDFDQQRPGQTAAESLYQNTAGRYTAYLPALEAAWRVGHQVVAKLVENWTKYRDIVPDEP